MTSRHLLSSLTFFCFMLGWNAVHAQQGPSTAEPPAVANEVASTVQAVAAILREGYVFPDIGEQMAEDILGRLERGEYDAFDDAALADRLTADLQAMSRDKHLSVVHTPPSRSSAAAMRGPRSAEDSRRENYYFRKVELLEGNIGYLRFDLFLADDEAKEIASAALAFLANADALIVDLRRNGGGSPDMILYITSYFFRTPTLLNLMIDRNGEVVNEYHTLDSVPGRRFFPDVPIYVLTSSYTFSGAEEFTYNLKHLNRATVIGETTGGGAHPVRGDRVSDRFMVRLPYLRAHNPISGTNWEGTGVRPHIEINAEAALDRAWQEARTALSGEVMLLDNAGWPASRAGAAAAAFFNAYGTDEAMTRFSGKFRTESARSGRSDEAYATFWREFAEAAVPISYVSRGEGALTVTAHLTRHDGREEKATFEFEFDPDPPHGLRLINVSTIR